MDWRPNIGNLLQALIIAGGIAAFIFTYAHNSQTDYSMLQARIGNMETRQGNVEQQLQDRTRLDEQFAADMRSSLEHISESLSDLRVQLAHLQRGGR